MSIDPKTYQCLMLRAEIAALLHDIGKFTPQFLQGEYHRHTHDFFDSLCCPVLKSALDVPLASWTSLAPSATNLLSLADLIRWHHEKNFTRVNEYYGTDQETRHLPMELYLLMYADTLDSASSKGGAAFNDGGGRQARLDRSCTNQKGDTLYLATPFGEEEEKLHLNEIAARCEEFQQALATILAGFPAACASPDLLKLLRDALLACLETHLSQTLAETRLPNNDVSLWQHSYSTAAIFKAMLAGHLLTGNYDYCDNKGNLTQYRERLALLGICWREDQLISRSFRPAEILGRRKRLDGCVERLKEAMETDHCLGNEIYRDRDGIYFLIPAWNRDDQEAKTKIEEKIQAVTTTIDAILNGEKGLGGELAWQARYLDVGLQITRLAEVISGGKHVQVLAAGPSQPLWIKDWKETKNQLVCPRCGCRPVGLRPVTVGSEGDDAGEGDVCPSCAKYSKEGGMFRDTMTRAVTPQGKRLLAVDEATRYLQFDIAKYFGKETDDGRRHRFALMQGIIDLRPFLSGQAFSSILAVRPEWYCKEKGKNDASCEMNTWDSMLEGCQTAWAALSSANTPVTDIARHTLQQIFQDTFLCNDDDGRAADTTGDEKGRNFLRGTVLAAPYAEVLAEDHEKLVNYALRQHPAPSRLARVWSRTLEFSRFPIRWCETNEVNYTTITIDPGRFMLLVEADQAWNLCQAIHGEYEKTFGRVRHLLPLHLSATVFYHKSPLYLAIDAARRFDGLGLENSGKPEWWTVRKQETTPTGSLLHLSDPSGRETVWRIPAVLPNGRKDQHYGWYWKQGVSGHPVPLEDLRADDTIAVFPSTFDYEILDSTTRRYDIRPHDDKTRQRPHGFRRNGGPRPYPLSVLRRWQNLDAPLRGVERSRRKALIELLARLHREWSGHACNAPHAGTLAHLAEDGIKITLGKHLWINHGPELLAMALDGSLFDLVEWQDYITPNPIPSKEE